MTTQSEAILESNLIQQLVGLGYAPVRIQDEAAMLVNLQRQLEAFNGLKFSEREFESILNHLGKGNVFERAKLLRDRFELHTDDEEVRYIRFFNPAEPEKNRFQVTNQVSIDGVHKNRYDVTLLVNGLPLVQIELKRRGIELKEAFNQIDRYKQSSYWTNHGLFQFVQLFIISNGVNTKYFANAPTQKALTFKQTFFWADVSNRNITDLEPFANSFLRPAFLSTMLSQYIVLNETHKMLMVLRPYQYFAVEAIVKKVKERPAAQLDEETTENNGYIWHTTGSGKTLTSFKASQILTKLPEIKNVVFVVDRKDLDFQTMEEFNNFKKDSVSLTANTSGLVNQFKDETKQQEFLNFVLDQYVQSGVDELDDDKLGDLLKLKYNAIADAKAQLGPIHSIRENFIGFQKWLYGEVG
jgi:type I restriction enzyme R subunit